MRLLSQSLRGDCCPGPVPRQSSGAKMEKGPRTALVSLTGGRLLARRPGKVCGSGRGPALPRLGPARVPHSTSLGQGFKALLRACLPPPQEAGRLHPGWPGSLCSVPAPLDRLPAEHRAMGSGHGLRLRLSILIPAFKQSRLESSGSLERAGMGRVASK